MQMEKAAAPATDYLHMEEPQPAGFKAGLSPKFVDSVLAGGALAVTSSLLHLTDILLGDYAPPFFCVPLLPSGLLFFAGPVPPPAKAFFLCTIIAWISGYLIYLSGPEDNGFKACLVAGVLLKLFKTSNNFFVPTVGLAATLLSDAASKSFWLARGQPEHAWPSRATAAPRDDAPGDAAGDAASPPPAAA